MIYARRRVVASNISLASYPRCRPTADVASCRRYCHLTRFSSRVGIAQLIPTHQFCPSVCLSVRHELVLCYKSSAVAEMGDRLATVVVGRKVGGGLLRHVQGSWVPSNTNWPGPRPTSVPSGILIHPTVWPQYTNATRQTGRQTNNGPIAHGEPYCKSRPKTKQ